MINKINNTKSLLSYEELKKRAKSCIKKKYDISNYKEAFKYYDVDPIINKEYLTLLNNIKDKNANNEFIRLMYTLNDVDRIELSKALKIDYKGKNSEEIFNNILNLLISDKINYKAFEQKLKKDYYIEFSELKIPFYEGNNEYFYSGLVNQFYTYFIELSSQPSQDDKIEDEKIIIIQHAILLIVLKY